MALLVPVVSWGQNVFINEKLIQAEEIKSSKGVCPEYIDALFGARDVAIKEEDKPAIINICELLLDAVQKVYPSDKELIYSCKLYLAVFCFEAVEYEKALPYLKECYQTIKGTDYESEHILLGDIITANYGLKNYDEAISFLNSRTSIVLKQEGKGLRYAGDLYWLSSIYIDKSDNKSAIKVLKECLSVLEAANLKEHEVYIDAKYRYEVLTTGVSSINSAIAVRRHALDLVQKYKETNDIMPLCEAMDYLKDKSFVPDIDTLRYNIISTIGYHLAEKDDFDNLIYVTTQKPYLKAHDWWILGNAQENLGRFEYAHDDYKNAFLDSYLEKNGVSDTFFYYLDCYARCCIQLGRYQEVFNLLEEQYALDITIPGKELIASLYMSTLADLKFSISDYRGTIECVNKCSPLLLRIGALDDYTQKVLLAAGCYEQLGDFAGCAREMRSLLDVYESNPEYADYIPWAKVSIALYSAQSGIEEATTESIQQIVKNYSTYKFSNFWMESVFHNALGHYYQFCGDNVNAEKEYLTGASILKANAPESDFNYPQHLATLGILYLQWPNNEHKALPVFEEAFNLIKKYHDPSYAQYFGYYEGVLAGKYASNTPTSLAEISDFVEVEKVQAQNLLFQMSEAERESFWKSHSDVKNLVFSFKETQSAPSFLYDYALLYKGLLLNSSMQIGTIVMNANDADLNALYGRYLVLSQEVENKSQETIDALEHQILTRCQSLGYSINDTYSYSDVAASIGDNAAAIEFVDYEQLEGAAEKDGVVKYVALLLKKGWNEPKLISLCTSAELEKVISEKHKAYEGNALYNLLWKPLESFLKDTKEVYYSPSGLIHQIALEAIPSGKGSILSDRYSLVRLSSTRELCNNNNVVNPYASSVVYGGLLYTLSDEDMLSNSQLYTYRSTPTSDDYLSRGGDTATPWRFLPGTRAEAEAVSALLSSSNISSKLFTGAAGNEESFKSLSGHAPSIIHIATHGFYLQNSDFVSSATTGNDVRGQLQIQKSALKRSGLIMSGANPAWTEGKLLPNVEDGILTAEEISRLDLRNTSLAIISACDSGLGEINNDGVEGLQRAFKSAGVNTLVVTLWKVDDAATELMMAEFYKNLTSGQPRRTAFDNARNTVRSKYQEPFYWAPFVMID